MTKKTKRSRYGQQHARVLFKHRAQALIMTVFFVALMGLLAAGLSRFWIGSVQLASLNSAGIETFYLAQAAVERGKHEVLHGYWPPGNNTYTYTLNNLTDLDIPGDNYQHLYTINILSTQTQRRIIGTGTILDANGETVASRQITVWLDGLNDSNGDSIDDTLSDNTIISWEQ